MQRSGNSIQDKREASQIGKHYARRKIKSKEKTVIQPAPQDADNEKKDLKQATDVKAPGVQEGALLSSDNNPEEAAASGGDSAKTEERKRPERMDRFSQPSRVDKIKALTRKQRRRQLRVLLLLFAVVVVATVFTIYVDYRERPGIVETNSLKAAERTPDSITLEWDHVRNTDTYALYYKKSGRKYKEWKRLVLDADSLNSKTVEPEKEGEKEEVHVVKKISGLDEGVKYVFKVRADNDERKGFITEGKTFSTMKTQKVEVRDKITKLTSSKPFSIDAKASTALTYKSSDEDVAKVDEKTGKVILIGPGEATITVKARKTDVYMDAKSKLKILVLASDPVSAGGASAHVIYNLDPGNCEVVKTIIGEGGNTHCPQSFGYSGEKYYIAYGSESAQRIITYDVDGDGRSVSKPAIDLGHPNGFCYADSTGLCYCVRGWSGRCVTYSPETGAYDVFTLPRGASGIAYDRDKNRFYTSSRTGMVSYEGDGSFRILNTVGVVKHKGGLYTQDCGGHAGIMMRCLSDSSRHGTNYIDLYDMEGGQYLGSFACELSEVESAVCDEDGYMLILANNTPETDYIWKTDINIKDIAEGL